MRFTYGLILFSFLLCANVISGQQTRYFIQPGTEDPDLQKRWKNKRMDSLALILDLRKVVNELRASAYLEASIDELKFEDSTATFKIHRGPNYEFGKLELEDQFQEVLAKAGYQPRNITGKKLEVSFIGKMFDRVIKVLENNGFPFANIQLKDYSVEEGLFTGFLDIDKGRLVTMDTFNLYGLDHISKAYLYNYLQMRPGDPYNTSEVLKIKNRINNLPFLELTSDPTVRFIGNSAIVNLKLQEKNASRFDFIIGIQPNSGQEQRYTITGDVNFEVQNKLKQGEQFAIKFERLKQETQRFDFNFQYPFLLDFPFGFDSEFNLFRNENKHRDLNFSFGVLYQLKANNFLKAFYNIQTSRLIEIDTQSIVRTQKLPSRLDVSTNNFGLQSNWQNLDYQFNPRKGYRILLRGTAGQKNIIPSNAILDLESDVVDFSQAYDSIDLSTYQFKVNVQTEFYLPIATRSTIKTALRAEKIFAETRIFENEYYRIGGNRLLRGFDEESVFAEFYTVATLEYRLLLSRNSFLAAFVDYGVRQNRYLDEFEWDQPYGAGAGFSLETAAGIFGVNVAVGSQMGNPLDFRNIKTHMGFLGLF
ncbi:BamA/TamA family outer membrane protein [Portibacter marinus]|uniref:ShlB/FhaC/HecB family hemolysin secretion/activation protein n=1 Tax=Portibacter marinus TaxID=2898660 RepID=UPI001F2E6454|nr:ShlB/FhaC/HecB family hemolysin secretion/activation protein [Portibacter marinus]